MRMLALEQNRVISASFFGKLKTVSQFAMIIVVLINQIVMVGKDPLQGGFGNFLVMILVINLCSADCSFRDRLCI